VTDREKEKEELRLAEFALNIVLHDFPNGNLPRCPALLRLPNY